MFKKYNRSDYIEIAELDSGSLERDLLLSNWDLFDNKRGYTFRYLTADDIQRPDLFCLRMYGRIDWWWILSKFNSIDDWWNDVFSGMRVKVPNITDIEEFYLKVKGRQ